MRINLGPRSFFSYVVGYRFRRKHGEVPFIGHLYRGYSISPSGSVIGLVWGFVDALIGGAIFAWLYNWLCTR